MKPNHSSSTTPRRRDGTRRIGRGFTLIELLVVIAIIGILAALIFPAGAAVKRKATLKRVEGELRMLAGAIETYKIDKGLYPPQNSNNKAAGTEGDLYYNRNTTAAENALYYELAGADVVDDSNTGNLGYRTLDGAVQFTMQGDLVPLGVGGLCNINGGRREATGAKNYLQSFKDAQHSQLPAGQIILSTVVKGPVNPDTGPSPFCYVTSSPWKRNHETFDLWVDVIVGGKTNRISNWSDDPEIISY